MTGDSETLAQVERALARGALGSARDALLPVLLAREDAACRLAGALLQALAAAAAPAGPDAMAAALDRMVTLAEAQERQIAALLEIVDGAA